MKMFATGDLGVSMQFSGYGSRDRKLEAYATSGMLPAFLGRVGHDSSLLTPRGACFQLACQHIGSVLCRNGSQTFALALAQAVG